jgi:hypothetical protein
MFLYARASMKLDIIKAIYKYYIFIEEGQCYVFNVFLTSKKKQHCFEFSRMYLACKVKVSLELRGA